MVFHPKSAFSKADKGRSALAQQGENVMLILSCFLSWLGKADQTTQELGHSLPPTDRTRSTVPKRDRGEETSDGRRRRQEQHKRPSPSNPTNLLFSASFISLPSPSTRVGWRSCRNDKLAPLIRANAGGIQLCGRCLLSAGFRPVSSQSHCSTMSRFQFEHILRGNTGWTTQNKRIAN